MKRLIVLMAALVLLASARPHRASAAPTLQFQGEITSPRPNAVLRGQITVEGTADHPEFWKYEVRVAPGLNPAIGDDQWFRLAVQEQRVLGGQLAVWNTNSFPDGVYTLRLRVVRLDGNWQDFDVRPLNVSNVAPPTATFVPPTPVPEASPTPLPSPTVFSSPTPLVSPTPVVIQSPTPAVSPTPSTSPTPTETATPQVIPTLEPSGQTPSPGSSPSPGETVAPGTTPLPTSPSGEGSPIVVAQPTIIVPTPTVFAAGGAGLEQDDEIFPTPSTGDSGLSLPNLEGFGVSGLASSCLTGVTFTAGVFLLLGLLYFLRSLVRMFR